MPVKIAWYVILGSGIKNLFENDRLISRGSKGRFARTATHVEKFPIFRLLVTDNYRSEPSFLRVILLNYFT